MRLGKLVLVLFLLSLLCFVGITFGAFNLNKPQQQAADLLGLGSLTKKSKKEDFKCFEISSKSKEVCSGNGKCIAKDVCLCDSEFTGSKCNEKSLIGTITDALGIPKKKGKKENNSEETDTRDRNANKNTLESSKEDDEKKTKMNQTGKAKKEKKSKENEEAEQNDKEESERKEPEKKAAEEKPQREKESERKAEPDAKLAEKQAKEKEDKKEADAKAQKEEADKPAKEASLEADQAKQENQKQPTPIVNRTPTSAGTPFLPLQIQSDQKNWKCFGIKADSKIPPVCSGRGDCISDDKCMCSSGFTGGECQKTIYWCFGIASSNETVCSSQGVCTETNVCSCNKGFSGLDCGNVQKPTCNNIEADSLNVCSGHGNCTAKNICECEDGYSGDECNIQPIQCFGIKATNPQVCSSHGNCTAKNACECEDGYSGISCNVKKLVECFGIEENSPLACSGNGLCVGSNNCSCYPGFGGKQCQKVVEPKCNGIKASSINVCSGRGVCVENNICNCTLGFTGTFCGVALSDIKCFEIKADSPKVCSGHGNCTATNNCECEDEYYGDECNIQPIQCFGIKATNTQVCSSHGNCTADNYCECEDGYSGRSCNVKKLVECFGIEENSPKVCSGKGLCVGRNNCSCYPGFGGKQCQKVVEPKCNGIKASSINVCSGRGVCVENNICNCTLGFTGAFCGVALSDIKCFGIKADSPKVCSGHGNCTANNICECEEGYFGEKCSLSNIVQCFGIPETDPNVCSGHGNCTEKNTCECEEGYFGNQCNISPTIKCFGIKADASVVCSGRGNCTAKNTCECEEGYYGDQCGRSAVVKCFTILASDPQVCSGNGACIKNNNCKCRLGFRGPRCDQSTALDVVGNRTFVSSIINSIPKGFTAVDKEEFKQSYVELAKEGQRSIIPVCFGLQAINEKVCSGRGACTDTDICACLNAYTGSNCEKEKTQVELADSIKKQQQEQAVEMKQVFQKTETSEDLGKQSAKLINNKVQELKPKASSMNIELKQKAVKRIIEEFGIQLDEDRKSRIESIVSGLSYYPSLEKLSKVQESLVNNMVKSSQTLRKKKDFEYKKKLNTVRTKINRSPQSVASLSPMELVSAGTRPMGREYLNAGIGCHNIAKRGDIFTDLKWIHPSNFSATYDTVRVFCEGEWTLVGLSSVTNSRPLDFESEENEEKLMRLVYSAQFAQLDLRKFTVSPYGVVKVILVNDQKTTYYRSTCPFSKLKQFCTNVCPCETRVSESAKWKPLDPQQNSIIPLGKNILVFIKEDYLPDESIVVQESPWQDDKDSTNFLNLEDMLEEL